MKDLKTKAEEFIRLAYTGLRHSSSYIYRYISFAEVGRICRAVFREPMHLCTCVSEKGGGGETTCSETPSLLSYILCPESPCHAVIFPDFPANFFEGKKFIF